MSIDPASILNALRVPPVKEGNASASSRSTDPFHAALQEALQPSGPKELNAAAEVLRLQLMRTTLCLEDEAETLPMFDMGKFPALIQRYGASREFDASIAASTPIPPAPAKNAPAAADPLDSVIERASRRYSVAPELVRAVIEAESDFNPKAVSPAGAQGLMQLMPGTAREMGVADSFDPEQNVMGGTRYLRQMLDRYDGDMEKALAAYNWGPGNLDRSDGSLPQETRRYIARIKGLLHRPV